jgi:hypothetical protein
MAPNGWVLQVAGSRLVACGLNENKKVRGIQIVRSISLRTSRILRGGECHGPDLYDMGWQWAICSQPEEYKRGSSHEARGIEQQNTDSVFYLRLQPPLPPLSLWALALASYPKPLLFPLYIPYESSLGATDCINLPEAFTQRTYLDILSKLCCLFVFLEAFSSWFVVAASRSHITCPFLLADMSVLKILFSEDDFFFSSFI